MEIISSKSNKITSAYIAFFDLDRTIISVNSGKILIKTAYSKELISRTQLIKAFWLSFLHKFELRDTVKIINSMAGWLKGIHESSLNELTNEIFEQEIKKNIRPEILDEILFHKHKGAKVIILSSAVAAICKPVADFLEMDDTICSALETEDGIFSGRPAGTFCYGEEKVARLVSYCNSRNIKPEDTWYYGDSIADLPVLKAAGTPVCVSPDKKLLKEATARNWRIIPCL